MEEQKKEFVAWFKANKKELIIAGISVSALVGIILCIKNRDSIEILWKSLSSELEKSPAKVPKVTQPTIEKFAQSSVPVTEAINPSEISAINTTRTFHKPFEVRDHIRNLNEGSRASNKKIATAAEYGYNLKPGQTWVDTYTKGAAVA